MGKIWFAASGSGGCGKSSIALGLAETATCRGIKTLLLDAAGPYRTCDLYLGIQSLITLDLTDVLLNRLPLDSAIYPVQGFPGLSYACTSLFSCIRLDEFTSLILTLQGLYDLIMIDLPTGDLTLSPSLLKREDRLILLTRPDPFAIRACEKLYNQYRSVPSGICPVVNFEDRHLLRKHLQYTGETVAQLLDCPVLGQIRKSQDFFTLRANGESAVRLSILEQRQFGQMTDALLK